MHDESLSLTWKCCSAADVTDFNLHFLLCQHGCLCALGHCCACIFRKDNDTHGNNPWVECYWLWQGVVFFLGEMFFFPQFSLQKKYKSLMFGYHCWIWDLVHRVDCKCKDDIILPCPYRSLRAVSVGACVSLCHPISHFILLYFFYEIVPFCPLLFGYKSLLFVQDQIPSNSLGICHGNQKLHILNTEIIIGSGPYYFAEGSCCLPLNKTLYAVVHLRG